MDGGDPDILLPDPLSPTNQHASVGDVLNAHFPFESNKKEEGEGEVEIINFFRQKQPSLNPIKMQSFKVKQFSNIFIYLQTKL